MKFKPIYALALIPLLLLIPFASGGGGILGRWCNVTVNVQGTYNSYLVTNYIQPLTITVSEGACFPVPTQVASLDLLPTTIPWTVSHSAGASAASSNQGTVTVPAGTINFNFQVSTVFSLMPGSYTFTWSSPISIGVNGPLSQTTAAFVVS